MKRIFSWWLALAFGLPLAVAEPDVKPPAPGKVYVLPIREDIMPPLVYLVRRGVKEAMEAKADALIIDMDTNGGRVDVTEEIIGILNKFPGRTVTYVNKKAFSAGAFISFATGKIYMAPESVIGAAAPVMMGPGGPMDLSESYEAKISSAMSALVRANAEKNGHNPDVANAMISVKKGLKIGDETISEEGEILTLTSSEAERKYGTPAKPLLSAGTIPSLEALIEKLELKDATVVRIESTGAETLATWINAISPLLLMVGLACLYIEYKTPGFGIFGTLGIVIFLVYFLGGYVAGLSGIEWVAVFFLGVVLVALEFFVFPGTILLGLSGVGLMLVALLMGMVDWYPGMPAIPSVGNFNRLIGDSLNNLFLGLAGGAVLIWLLSKWLPKTQYYPMLISQTASGVESIEQDEKVISARVGQTGITVSQLRPGGKARFGEELVDVISAGEIIERDRAVKIVRHSGRDPVVEEIV